MKAYHGTKHLSAVLRDGLRVPPYPGWGCRIGHVCLTDRPEIAAELSLRGEDPGVVEVDLTELELPPEGFVGCEMRIHHDIEPERLAIYTAPVVPSIEGHVDPITYPGENHPTCLRLLAQARAAGHL
ncbi:MAG TPA: hypothetical protein VMU58_14325 [Gaiellaceae bacterium]|nr:hypothetical protein [Gaiellaceae bacterium]